MNNKELVDLVTEDAEFDNKVYSAIHKKMLPDMDFSEPTSLANIVGTLVLIFLGLVAVMSLVDAYSVRQYNKHAIEFKA